MSEPFRLTDPATGRTWTEVRSRWLSDNVTIVEFSASDLQTALAADCAECGTTITASIELTDLEAELITGRVLGLKAGGA